MEHTMASPPLELTIYSDFLCPWCFNAQVRLKHLQQTWGNRLSCHWKSFMLVPEERQQTREAFQTYSHKWLNIGEQPDSGEFAVWDLEKEPPNHSLPALTAAKVAQTFGHAAYSAFQDLLMVSYYRDHCNIADDTILFDLAKHCGMDEKLFEKRYNEPHWQETIWQEHRDALDKGIKSIPTVVINDEMALIGALSIAEYETAFQKHCH